MHNKSLENRQQRSVHQIPHTSNDNCDLPAKESTIVSSSSSPTSGGSDAEVTGVKTQRQERANILRVKVTRWASIFCKQRKDKCNKL